MRTAVDLFKQCVDLNPNVPDEAFHYASQIDEPSWLADMIISTLPLSLETRHELLMMADPLARLQRVISLLAKEIDVLKLEGEIQARVASEVDRSLNARCICENRCAAIQTELGDDDIWEQDIDELRQKIETIGCLKEVKAAAEKRLNRLAQMSPMSPELGVIRNLFGLDN
jgi:ATP-dependent Lon protease